MDDIINNCSQSVLTDEQGAACFAIAERVVNALIKHGLHISFAESCTGGLAAARIVDVPNASYVLDASFVTYANQAKVKFVNVAEESIAEHGIVERMCRTLHGKRRSGGGKCRNRRRHFRHCRAFRRLTRKTRRNRLLRLLFRRESGMRHSEVRNFKNHAFRCGGKAGCPQCKREFCF